MNVGTIITRALQRAKMSVNDAPTRLMALDMLDEVIQPLWHSKKWRFRKSTFSFTTATNIEEYALHKLVGEIVPNSMRGSDPVRMLEFEPSHDFYRKHQGSLSTGTPYCYRDGEMAGINTQPSAASVITIASSLSNYTTGTVTVVYGSRRVIGAGGATFTIDMLNRFFRVGSELQRYRVTVLESSSQILLDRPYEGASASGSSYAIGDIQQTVTVQGLLTNGIIDEEELQLNGATSVVTTKTFASLIKITKSGRTYGYVTATSNAAVITNVILSPGEFEADYRTIKLYPIPSTTETIEYESYGRHPFLYRDSDSPLFPSQWHPLLLILLYIKLLSQFHEKQVPQEVLEERDRMLTDMTIGDNDSDEWSNLQEREFQTGYRSNYPETYGEQDGDF